MPSNVNLDIYTIFFNPRVKEGKVDGKGNVCEAKMARGGKKKKKK